MWIIYISQEQNAIWKQISAVNMQNWLNYSAADFNLFFWVQEVSNIIFYSQLYVLDCTANR